MGSTVGLGAVGPDVKPLSSPPVIPVVELNRFAYEPLVVGSLSQDRTSLSKIRVSLPWLTGSFFSDAKHPRKVFGLKNEYLLIPPDYLAND